ncbi:F5/8 type C domain protein [Planctomycetes bacterium CA13]|uniref:F5/8 type C domain protein n=1 Tax=Novipirellula herctigrandis TaxID=2527986 RepID=A0A5C5ZAI1_9BACT|nr:F5/8 type C domain protein [Planctomycetes bacterium CA13]
MKNILVSILLASSLHAAPLTLTYDKPVSNWEKEGLPIGNGSLGGVVMGGVNDALIQFNVDSLWTGDENPDGVYDNKTDGSSTFGSYQNFGELSFKQLGRSDSLAKVTDPFEHHTSSRQTVQQSIDGKANTKWCFEHHDKSIIWQADLRVSQPLHSYSFTSANDVPGRDPAQWKLEGSDDGTTWILLDKQVDIAPMDRRGQKNTYALKNSAKHRYYRFTFIPRKDVSHFQVAEISLDGIGLGEVPAAPDGYSRSLDIANAKHTTTWQADGTTFTRQAIASFPDQVIAWNLASNRAGSISGAIQLTGAHPDLETVDIDGQQLRLRGTLPNGLRYEARAQVIAQGGNVAFADDTINIRDCDSVLILLAADTNYVMSSQAGWMKGDPAEKTTVRLADASKKTWQDLLTVHTTDYQGLFSRVSIDLGETDESVSKLTTDKRMDRYRQEAKDLPRPCLDPELEALIFQYGRYLLIASSRPGSLPANLQGIWCNSNSPAWFSDYHSNINLQMNYWLAETANLSELAEPLFDMLSAGVPVYSKHTVAQFGDVPGFVTRMSINPFGGSGWNWNIEGTAWLAQHYFMHYEFSGDKTFLAERAYPFMRDVSRFWLAKLKRHENGSLVVPNVWSHEHGPYEDGTAHAQQLMHDLFSNTLTAGEALRSSPTSDSTVDNALLDQLRETIPQLHGPKIGSWGQLMEWMEEKPKFEKSNHRHTSHLFAVFPGSQINLRKTPKLAEAARVSLTQRGEVGDSRRSWTWAWRTALWARLGMPDRAHGCIAGLLAHNTFDNLWTTHPPFQIDGNLGITGGMAEIFLQSHVEMLELLPALPDAWPHGNVKGLRARGGHFVDLTWRRQKLVEATIHPATDSKITIYYAGKTKTLNAKKGAPVSVTW